MTAGSLAKALVATSTSELMTAKVIVIDWVDGPLEGFLSLENPESAWHFRLFADNIRHDDVDDRLFALTPISGTLIQEVLNPTDMDDGRTIVIPEALAVDLTRLNKMISQFGPPEVLAIFDESMLIERAWLIRPDVEST
ncbi:MAG: hypothetical protein M3Z25_04610 [Actinomycetota bacterium]|nr:hypothetical protein [Actinomycetota bacterium]